jgi:hypothetical protein
MGRAGSKPSRLAFIPPDRQAVLKGFNDDFTHNKDAGSA